MIRLRFAGILLTALSLLGSSAVMTAQTKAPAPATKSAKPAGLKPLDINTASEDEFVEIGIERATAKKIVQGRPFRSKSELVSRKLVTRELYDKVKNMVVAKRPPKSPAK